MSGVGGEKNSVTGQGTWEGSEEETSDLEARAEKALPNL